MISRLDVEAFLSGEFVFDEESYASGHGPLSEQQAADLGLECVNGAVPSTSKRYSGWISPLGLYATTDRNEYDHFWEARKEKDQYLLVHMGDLLDFLLVVDEDDLWVEFGLSLLKSNYETLCDPNAPGWQNLQDYSRNQDVILPSTHRAIILKAGEILQLQDMGEAI